mgnify:CR=1 FL=1
MKKHSTFLVLAILGTFLLAGNAMATFFPDTVFNWPGQIGPEVDRIGSPEVLGFDVTVGEDMMLKSIVVQFGTTPTGHSGRLEKNGNIDGEVFMDSLYINQAGMWDSWEYYVQGVWDNNTGAEYNGYVVEREYKYLYANTGRVGHAAGIAQESLISDEGKYLIGTEYDDKELTLAYYFAGIQLGDSFTLGYTPYCANDNLLTPVPEPATMLLLGIGLIGLAGVGRKKFLKKG